jgi:hypothetical protein
MIRLKLVRIDADVKPRVASFEFCSFHSSWGRRSSRSHLRVASRYSLRNSSLDGCVLLVQVALGSSASYALCYYGPLVLGFGLSQELRSLLQYMGRKASYSVCPAKWEMPLPYSVR